jgi:phosphate transport system permease protein
VQDNVRLQRHSQTIATEDKLGDSHPFLRRRRPRESIIQSFLFLSGTLSILTTIGIVVVLGRESIRFFSSQEVSIREFLTSTKWQPQIGNLGIWPLVNATLMTSAFATMVALPLGLSVAIFLSEYASPRSKPTSPISSEPSWSLRPSQL